MRLAIMRAFAIWDVRTIIFRDTPKAGILVASVLMHVGEVMAGSVHICARGRENGLARLQGKMMRFH